MTDLVEWLETAISAVEADTEAMRGVFPRPAVDADGAVWLHIHPAGHAVIAWYPQPQAGYVDMERLRNWAGTERGMTREAVLRRCAADRKILAKCVEWIDDGSGITSGAQLGRRVLRALAEGYGYQEVS